MIAFYEGDFRAGREWRRGGEALERVAPVDEAEALVREAGCRTRRSPHASGRARCATFYS
jgi:hypothetical protein